MSNFKIGQKVVCLHTRPIRMSIYNDSLSRLRKDAVYTVSRYEANHEGQPSIWLEEVKSTSPNRGFDASRFRPLLGEDATKHLLESIVVVKETSDSTIKPIKQPQTA